MISILSAVKDRQEHLLSSVSSWIDCECVSEIIITDWGSKEPICDKLPHSDKIRIIRVNPDHCEYWSFSQAYNLSARICYSDYLLFINADEIIVDPKQLCSLERPSEDFYYEGVSWDSDKAHGVYFLYMMREMFWKVNGFNERLIGYGYDDVDIRKRLRSEGFVSKPADAKIEHIKHKAEHKSRENMVNYGISWVYPWEKDEKMIELENFNTEGNVIYCDIEKSSQITKDMMRQRDSLGGALSRMLKE